MSSEGIDLDALQARDFIRRYVVDGQRYIQILSFLKHQSPHIREADSTIPQPPRAVPSTVLHTNLGSEQKHDLGSAEASPRSPVPVLVLVPESVPVPVPESVPESVPVPRSGEKYSGATAAPPPPPTNGDDDQNVRVITKVAHEVLDLMGLKAPMSDLTEAVKGRCATLRLAYTSRSVAKALDSALVQQQRKT